MTQARRPSTRTAGRPREAVLSRDLILEAAFALADERGADFTLAALARRLEVRPSALHHYFSGRDELVAGMRGRLTTRVGGQQFREQPWYEAVFPWARAYRSTLGAHPGLIATLATLPVAGEPESMADYERIAEAFARAGYPEHRVVPAILALESFIIGSALDALAPEDNLRPTSRPELTPHLTRAEQAARRSADACGAAPADTAFEFGLAALVAGLRAAGEGSGGAIR